MQSANERLQLGWLHNHIDFEILEVSDIVPHPAKTCMGAMGENGRWCGGWISCEGLLLLLCGVVAVSVMLSSLDWKERPTH